MKTVSKFVGAVLLVSLILGCLAGCVSTTPDNTESTGANTPVETVDYAGSIQLDMGTKTAKVEVTVKSYVDGDTTHFNCSPDINPEGVLKIRYLAVNTPESTGKIEEWGKKASNFTKEKLKNATSIIVEAETEEWTADSTGSRYLGWVWYKTADSDQYRNLNIEILQNGLAIANSSANNSYGSVCTNAINQAKAQKLNIYSGEKDPDFYYGEAQELTLKELRTNIETYNGVKVAFNGVITRNNDQTVYVEAHDPETDMYYGMSVYYGFNLTGGGLDILSVGNEVRIVGTVQYYETGGTWQVSGLSYNQMKPKDPGNIQKLSDGHVPAYVPTTADKFVNGKVEVEVEGEVKSFDYAALAMSSSISMANLKVIDVYTTVSNTDSNGAMTLTCEVDGVKVTVRTVVLRDENKEVITADAYMGKTIDVKGIIDYFSGEYQIKVISAKDITVH